jgi:hypothetical protein
MVPVEEDKKIITPIKSKTERRTITIQKSEYDEWLKLKEEHTWTTLLKTVREGYLFFKKVMANLTVKVQGGVYQPESVGRPLKRIPSSNSVQKLDPKSPKALVLKEIKEASEGKMSIEEFQKSLLKPLTEEELLSMQKSEEELDEAQKKAREKKETRLEDLNPPG